MKNKLKNFVLLCLVLVFLSACASIPKPYNYSCNEEQFKLMVREYELCNRAGYLDTFCFAQAKATLCTKITKEGSK